MGLEQQDYNDMLQHISQLINKHDITKTYIDGSDPAFIRSLKITLGEYEVYEEYDKVIEQAKRKKD